MRFLVLTFMLFLFTSLAIAQDDYYQPAEEKDSNRFFIGFNIGGHFANTNTAVIYTGRPDITPFGISWIFNNPINQQVFNDHFRFPFQISEFPQEPTYRSEIELGVHAGYEINKRLSVFMEINTLQMSYEQFFTITIDDPFSRTPGDVFRQIPIIGEENRFHFNLGGQFNYFQNETKSAYVSFFGNMNNVSMRRNFIIVNNIEYSIIHIDENRPDLRPGGTGFGFGGGLGFRFLLTDHILIDPYYQLYHTQINMSEEIQAVGTHHSIGVRILWN